jgi:hypothetical protein
MSIAVTIEEAMRDRHLLGSALGDIETFAVWLVILKAAFGLGLNRQERRLFNKVAGSRKPPSRRVRELWAIVGRRGGKTRIAAALAVFLALCADHAGKLAPGETGYVLVLAASKAQADACFSYCRGFIEASPILGQQIDTITSDEIRLKGGIVIAVHPNNFRTVRGRTLLACIFDEVAFWRDEGSAQPDIETLRAVLPALATTGGMLIGISSPYRQIGLMHSRKRDYFGKEDPDVLVVAGATQDFNPTIDKSVIERARREDPTAAASEWDGEFRADIAQFLPDEVIDDAVDQGRPLELPPREGAHYRAFMDASAGRHDAYCLGIGHCKGDKFIADVIRGRKPPFDVREVTTEFVKLAREYRCGTIVGDNYAGEWVKQAVEEAGGEFRRSDMAKSGLYLEALPFFMRGAVSMPNLPPLVRELRLLERRTSRSGRDSVDHPPNGGTDDHANVLAGCMREVMADHRRAMTEDYGIAFPKILSGPPIGPQFWNGPDGTGAAPPPMPSKFMFRGED